MSDKDDVNKYLNNLMLLAAKHSADVCWDYDLKFRKKLATEMRIGSEEVLM